MKGAAIPAKTAAGASAINRITTILQAGCLSETACFFYGNRRNDAALGLYCDFVGIDYAHYKQDSFREDGSVYSLGSDGFSDDYLAGEIGVDMKRERKGKTYGLTVAYRRVFDGDVQHTGYSYVRGTGLGFGVQSMNRSKDHIAASAYASAKRSDRWEIGGAVEQDWSHTSRDMGASVQFMYSF